MRLLPSKLLKCLICLTFCYNINCDYYTSVVGLEDLLNAENYFVNSVEKYFGNVIKINNDIESFLDQVELEHKELFRNPSKYLHNLNILKIIKRLVLDWKYIEVLTEMAPEYEAFTKSITLPSDEYSPPKDEDLQGASRGLSRLQQIYNLKTEDLVNGYIRENKFSEGLTAHDCFILARSLYESGEYLYASDWFMEAMKQLNIVTEQDDNDNVDQIPEYPYVTYIEVLEFLGAALFNAGNLKLANTINKQLLQIDPENQFGFESKNLFESEVKAERRVRTLTTKQTQKSELDAMKLYTKVCSGELQQTPKEKRTLRCRYVTNNVPYYFIGPFKMEELSLEPIIAYYHQVIYDNEIEQIIEKVEGKVERSRVGALADWVYNETRISKNSWLWYEQHDFLTKIYDRLEDITGLSLSTGEPLQVVNYGIGGHYGPHYDFSNPESDYNGRGNRIVTALFYINDVEMGGATAFPFLHLAVQPIKHSLLVWYNMHKSLEHDYRAKHAGCPVLKGSKWICTEWFHAVGQEFKRPCDLKPDGEISIPFRDHKWD